MKKWLYLFCISSLLLGTSCSKDGDVNFFSVDKDIELGQQLEAQIAADPNTYPLLSESAYPDAYAHVRRIRDKILNSSHITYRDRFAWSVKIIQDDNTLNAFAAPGGYIYVYTGILKYLSNENEFAGVLGHEMAHADRRHSTDQLTKQYGLAFMLQVVAGGNSEQLAQIAAGLLTLKFSRADEAQADEMSVVYLCDTDYKANGAAGFFEKLIAQGGATTPAFLSTHPSPDRRVESINEKEISLGCSGTNLAGDYASLLKSLP